MKFGFTLKHRGLDAADYAEVAEIAEANGFESVWVPEHVILPTTMPGTYPYSADGQPRLRPDEVELEPLVVLAAVAARTTTLRLGVGVYLLPLRHPLHAARAVMTLDRVSRGRAVLGVGVGWLREEFEMLGADFESRGARTDEAIAVMRRLWTEARVEHPGPHHPFGEVAFEPKPVAGAVPVEIGGSSPPALRRAGRLGDGWIEIGTATEAEFVARLARVHEARAAAGRLDLPFEVTGGRALGALGVERAAELGVTRLVVGPDPFGPPTSVGVLGDWIRRYADEVIAG